MTRRRFLSPELIVTRDHATRRRLLVVLIILPASDSDDDDDTPSTFIHSNHTLQCRRYHYSNTHLLTSK
jgi:hypothetical protein